MRHWGTELLGAESIQAEAMVSDGQPWSANMGPTWPNFFMGVINYHQIVMVLDMFLRKHSATYEICCQEVFAIHKFSSCLRILRVLDYWLMA